MVFQIPETIEKKLSVKLKIVMVVGSVVVLVGATFAGYYFGQKRNTEQSVVQNNDYNLPATNTAGEVVPDPVTVPDVGYDPESEKYIFATTKLPQEIATKIIWSKPKEVANLKWFRNDFGSSVEGNYMWSKYYEVGSFQHESASGKVLLVEIPPEGPGDSWFFYIIDFKKELTVLVKYSWWNGYDPKHSSEPEEALHQHLGGLTKDTQKLVKLDSDFRIPELEFPKTLKGLKDRQVLILRGVYPLQERIAFSSPATQVEVLVFTDSQFGKVYTSPQTGGFYLQGPDNTRAAYALEPDFFNKDSAMAQIIWNDGSWNGYEFAYQDQGGCGVVNHASVVTSTDVTVRNDLEVVGKTSKGDSIYELKDKNHRLLKAFYDMAYFPGSYNDTNQSYNKISYEEFITIRPIIFWVDPFGRIIKLTNRRFVAPAECGKPVIYLYPEKTSVVDVKVEPQGGMTISDPFYNGGWQVRAEPNGQLTEIKSGKLYPYLFWEGTGGLYQTPERGFLMKKENIAKELPEKLTQLGMNTSEIKDFMEFWYPRMQSMPYYFVTFLGTQQMNQLAPLTINPRPDTVVRILMDFTPLDKPIDVLPLSLGRTPERKGFTVIEWGGVIR